MSGIPNNTAWSTPHDEVFQYAESLGFGELHFKMDPATGLFAIVAIHTTKPGPGMGGCRCISYPSTEDAIKDALRLAKMMTLKSCISKVAHGGAKSVLIKPEIIKDRVAYFEAFGEFVESLGGRYITAVDSGTSTSDMDIISHTTQYVTCTSRPEDHGDPSTFTALGIRRGIEAAIKHQLNKDSLKDVHVLIQGAGHVGYSLAKELHLLGARLSVCDINRESAMRCMTDLDAVYVHPDQMWNTSCDVFAPCALGGVLNKDTIPKLKTIIVAGSANNQLAEPEDGMRLKERGILYVPDFVINAGGLIRVSSLYNHHDSDHATQQIMDLHDVLLQIFERAHSENKTTHDVAEQMALENLENLY